MHSFSIPAYFSSLLPRENNSDDSYSPPRENYLDDNYSLPSREDNLDDNYSPPPEDHSLTMTIIFHPGNITRIMTTITHNYSDENDILP